MAITHGVALGAIAGAVGRRLGGIRRMQVLGDIIAGIMAMVLMVAMAAIMGVTTTTITVAITAITIVIMAVAMGILAMFM